MMKILLLTKVIIVFALLAQISQCKTITFQDVIDVIIERREEISKHPFFVLLSNESIPVQKRMQFIPYWTYFAMTFADVADNWIRIPDPQTELEERVNAFANEDNFHYNLFLHDVELVMGYTLERFGTYAGVMRHLWGDDSKAVRQLLYTWIAAIKNTNDPIVKLASIESVEAGLKDIFEVTFVKVYNNLPSLKYFGLTHVELEVNHTQTSWFKEGDAPFRPLASFEVSPEAKDKCLVMVNEIFDRFQNTYDAMYNLSVEDETIYPKKYLVTGYPSLSSFPETHPNKQRASLKDEL